MGKRKNIKSTNAPSASNRTKRSDNGSGKKNKKPKGSDEKKRRASTKPPGSRVRQRNTRKGVERDERRGKEPSGEQRKGQKWIAVEEVDESR